MRPYSIIVFNIFSDQILKMLLSEHKEIIKAFSFNGSNPAFCIRIEIG